MVAVASGKTYRIEFVNVIGSSKSRRLSLNAGLISNADDIITDRFCRMVTATELSVIPASSRQEVICHGNLVLNVQKLLVIFKDSFGTS